MKKPALAALALLTSLYSFGQQRIGIKIYQNTDLFEKVYLQGWRSISEKPDHVINFSRFSVAVNLRTKKHYFHEIEFFIPEISKSLDHFQFPLDYPLRESTTFDGKATAYSFRYELSKRLTNAENRFAFDMGLGLNPYYVYLDYIPNIENAYALSNKLYGAMVNLIPRIEYKFSRRMSLDLNVPVRVYDLQRVKTQIHNPNIPFSQQIKEESRHLFFESVYTIRLGLTYAFGKSD